MKSYTTLINSYIDKSLNKSNDNVTRGTGLINDAHRRFLEKYFFNENSTTILTVAQQQSYNLPYDFSQLKTGTITIGSLKWTPTEILTRRDWDILNTMQLYADIPNNYYIYGGKFNIFPIPSTTGNTITFNYKRRTPDLNIADYATGTISVTNNSAVMTGSGTAFLTTFLPAAGDVTLKNLWIKITPPKGFDTWYQIQSIQSDTQLTLVNPYQETTVSGASYIIGQMPLLLEDYHDVLVFDALVTYYSTIDKVKTEEYKERRKEITDLMDDYVGKKSLNVNLASPNIGRNPNLYQNNIGN